MTNIQNERFNVELRSENDVDYLIIGVDINEKVNKYQVEIIGLNDKINFLPIDVVKQENASYFCYEIASKISLTQVIENTELSREEILNILIEITKFIISCYRFLLTDTSLVLNTDYIYLDIDTGKVNMVYVPIDCSGDVTIELKDLIELILNKLRNNPENKEVEILDTISNLINSGIDDIKEFYRILKEMYEGSGNNIEKKNEEKLTNSNISNKHDQDNLGKGNVENFPNGDNASSDYKANGEIDYYNNLVNEVYNDNQNNNIDNGKKKTDTESEHINEKENMEDIKGNNVYERGNEEENNYEDYDVTNAMTNYQVDEYLNENEVNGNDGNHNYIKNAVYKNWKVSSQKGGVRQIFVALIIQLIIIILVGGVIASGALKDLGEKNTTYAFLIASAVVVSAIIWDKVLDTRLLKKRKDQDLKGDKRGIEKNEYLDEEKNRNDYGGSGGNDYMDDMNYNKDPNLDFNNPYSHQKQDSYNNSYTQPNNQPNQPNQHVNNAYGYNNQNQAYNMNQQQDANYGPNIPNYNQNMPQDQPQNIPQNIPQNPYNAEQQFGYTKTQGLDINQIQNEPVNNYNNPNIAPNPQPVPNVQNQNMNVVDPYGENEETVVMFDEGDVKVPYLEDLSGKIGKNIFIDKDRFVVGRMKKQSDFACQNNSVGRVHAEILTKNGAYYIKDLNSRNGTYLNGQRIESNREYIVSNNDRISFANSHFKFVVNY